MAARKPAAPAYRVVEGTQVHFEGVTYEGGADVPLEEDPDSELIAYWTNAGWIETT